MTPEELVKLSKPDEALAALQERVRANAADSKLRVFLFQLLCVLGRWEKALIQLDTVKQLDKGAILFAEQGRQAILCEMLRQDVFAGKRHPLILGEPAEWIGMMVQANQFQGQGNLSAASELRARALELAPTTPGAVSTATPSAEGETLTTQTFEWIMDGDGRLGPMLEVIVEGKYYWAPFDRIAEIRITRPADLRDSVWTPIHVRWTSGGETEAAVPTRYPGSESDADGSIKLARSTRWTEDANGTFLGLGQRVLTTDAGEAGLMDIRKLTLGAITG